MARRHPRCVKEQHAPAFEKMIELNKGDEIKAFEQYEQNRFSPTDEATALINEDVVDNPFTLEDVETDTPVLAKEKVALKKIKALLIAKVKNLNRIVESSHKGLKKGRDELQDILDKIDEAETEEVLIDFIKAAHNMTTSAETWMGKFEDGTKKPTLDNLKRIEEYIAPFTMLKDISANMFTTEDSKKIFEGVKELVGRQEEIRTKYLDHTRGILAEALAPNFNKIIRLAEKQAEKDFNKYKKPFVDKKEVAHARQKYIADFISSRSEELNRQTRNYIENMMLQVVDIPQLHAQIVNPKDLNHPIMDMAVQVLDEADMKVWNEMEEIMDESERINADFVATIGKKNSPKEQYAELLIKDEDGNITPELINPTHPSFLDFSKKHKGDNPIWTMHKHLMKMAKAKNAMVFKGGRLDYQLPFLEQTNLERIYDRGLLSAIKDGTLDQFKLRGKDVELGTISESDLSSESLKEKSDTEQSVFLNEHGDERAMIPLHYRNANIDMKDQSFDVMRSMVLDYHNSLRFKNKTEVSMVLLTLKDVMHAADIRQQTSFKRKMKISKESGDEHTTEGTSQLEQTLNALIRHRLYGIAVEGDPGTAKIYQAVGRYTSMVTMAANHVSGIVNLVHGVSMAWIEAASKNKNYFSKKDLAKATATYTANVPGFMKDVSERVPKNKINLIMRRFNAFSEAEMLNGKSFAQNSKVKRMADSSALMMFNQAGEHAMMTQVALASLSNIKVKDVNGDFLDKDFKPTTDRSEAIGVDDGLIILDGKLQFDPSIASTEKTDGVGQDDVTKISKHIRRIARDLYGNYDSQNKTRIQRTGGGAMLLQMRGWLVTGYQKRFKGLQHIKMELGEEYQMDRLEQLAYNPEINEFEEGQYITTLRFLGRTAQELKALKLAAAPEVWARMDDQQKANVRKTLIEAGLAVTFLMLSMMFEDDPDDPDDIANMYLAYTTRRVYSELAAFANPNDALRTFKSPAIAISTVENAFNTTVQMFNPMEKYEGGRHSGENKLWRDIKKLLPVIKQIDRNLADSYQWLKN